MTFDVLRPRAGPAALVLAGHALRQFARSPMSAFFTIAFPLSFFVIVNAIVGDAGAGNGVRVSQYLVAPFAVFGAAEAVFCVLATDLAALRENGVLKRLRGTPVAAWRVLAARIGAAAVVAVSSVVLLFAVGVLAYNVQVVWRKVPAALVVVLVGVACFAALGLALVGLTRSVVAAQTLSNGLLIPLAFVSNVFIVGADLPWPLAWIGRVLPLRHFADALSATFDPAIAGNGFRPGDLAVMAGWGVAGVAMAGWRFGWEPRRGERPLLPRRTATPAPADPPTGLPPATTLPVPPGLRRMLGAQIRAALLSLRRDPLSAFFGVVFPVLLLLLFPAVFADARFEGIPIGTFLVPAMTAYAIAVIAYVNTPTGVAQAGERGTLERLRGTPAPLWTFYAGRSATTVLIAGTTAVLLVAVGGFANGYRPDPQRLPAALLAFTLGVGCFSALGFALVAALRASQAVAAVALGTLLPLSFISDVFVIGDGGPPPVALRLIADVFPLKHLSRAMLEALGPAGGSSGTAWTHLGVLLLWTLIGIIGVALATRRARRTAGHGTTHHEKGDRS